MNDSVVQSDSFFCVQMKQLKQGVQQGDQINLVLDKQDSVALILVSFEQYYYSWNDHNEMELDKEL